MKPKMCPFLNLDIIISKKDVALLSKEEKAIYDLEKDEMECCSGSSCKGHQFHKKLKIPSLCREGKYENCVTYSKLYHMLKIPSTCPFYGNGYMDTIKIEYKDMLDNDKLTTKEISVECCCPSLKEALNIMFDFDVVCRNKRCLAYDWDYLDQCPVFAYHYWKRQSFSAIQGEDINKKDK